MKLLTIALLSDHYMQVLNCKQHCAVELASAAGKDKPFEDFLPSHFNYLQFSYYNSESNNTNVLDHMEMKRLPGHPPYCIDC